MGLGCEVLLVLVLVLVVLLLLLLLVLVMLLLLVVIGDFLARLEKRIVVEVAGLRVRQQRRVELLDVHGDGGEVGVSVCAQRTCVCETER